MITVGNKKVGRFFIGASSYSTISLGSIYTGSNNSVAKKMWEAVSSCFGSGLWRGAKVWKRSDKWKY